VQPAAGDAGGALGAALAFHHLHHGGTRAVDGEHDAMCGALLGPEYGEDEMQQALHAAQLPVERLAPAALHARIAERLDAGDVVGFFHGRAEFGPRALGARSILGDARNPAMQRQLNLKIKFRESFRPFAPIVLAERAQEYFDLPAPSPYMLFTAPVRAERRRTEISTYPTALAGGPPLSRGELTGSPVAGSAGAQAPGGVFSSPALLDRVHEPRSDLPAITHLDYSARVQTVEADTHPALHAVLAAFADRTGCAVLVNTSFNVRGEPPICHPREAIAGFLATEMDCLALGPFFLEKRHLDPALIRAVPQREFAPD
jgi:carbamoyltransferase